MVSRFLCGLQGPEQEALLYKNVSMKCQSLFGLSIKLCSNNMTLFGGSKLLQITKDMKTLIKFRLWAASEWNAVFFRAIIAALDINSYIPSIWHAL